MNRLLLLLLAFFISLQTPAQCYFGTDETNGNPCLILMNPTAGNIETILNLIEKDIFPLSENYNLIGFYNTAQAYNFKNTEQFINESGRKNIFLHACSESPGNEIFAANPCTQDFRESFENSEGVIFFGGPDIPPAMYGKETNLLTSITDYHRHTFEISFLFHLTGGFQNENFKPLLEEKPDYMIMGICLGMQTMNVAAGGTMIQDIPTEIYGKTTAEEVLKLHPDCLHRNYHTVFGTKKNLFSGTFHRLKISLPEKLEHLLKNSTLNPGVYSNHHQAAGKIGKNYLVAATSTDGKVAEIIVHKDYQNVIGFQFHPEPAFLYQPDKKLKTKPGKPAKKSFTDLYPKTEGKNFNINIWKRAAEWLNSYN